MFEKKELIVPFDVTAEAKKNTFVEYDTVAHKYKPYSSGEIKGMLTEDVSINQEPETARVLFKGIVFEDKIDSSVTVTDDMKAELRTIGIFIEKRISDINY